MRERNGVDLGGWAVWPPALVILSVVSFLGCTTVTQRSPRDLPLLIENNQVVLVPREQIGRYRCASGGILQCAGPSDQSAECVCSPWPIEL